MKKSTQWLQERCHSLKGVDASTVREIQRDALVHAASLMTAHADNPEKAFNAIHNLTIRLAHNQEE